MSNRGPLTAFIFAGRDVTWMGKGSCQGDAKREDMRDWVLAGF